jgi:ArsR family transcriptional regulator
MKLETAATQLDSLGNPTRLQIFRLLVRAGAAGLPVGALQARMGMAASTLSHHLKRLIDAGLVTQERAATTLVCRAVYAEMWALIGFLQDECCADEGCIASPAPGAGAEL